MHRSRRGLANRNVQVMANSAKSQDEDYHPKDFIHMPHFHRYPMLSLRLTRGGIAVLRRLPSKGSEGPAGRFVVAPWCHAKAEAAAPAGECPRAGWAVCR